MKKLTESEARFRALFENAAISIFIHNSETGELVEANRKAVEDYGLSSLEELKAKDYWLPEPYSLQDAVRWVRKAAAEGPQRFEWKDLDREGRTYWRDISLKSIVLNGIPRVMAITQDITERKRAEESLKRSESENRVLINALPDLLFRITREGTIRDYRCSDVSKLYVPPDVFMGKKIQDVLPASIAGRAIELMGQVFASGKPRTLEYELDVQGEKRFYDDRIVYLDQDEVLHVIRDITERKRAERSLALLNFALDNVHEAAFLVDEQARIRYVNEGSCRALGYNRNELLSLSVSDIDSAATQVIWADHWRELKSRGSITFEGCHRAKDGRVFPVEISANYFEYDGSGYNLGMARDITERKKAEEALRVSEERFRKVFYTSPDAIIMTRYSDGGLVTVNEGFTRILGYAEEEVVGKTTSALNIWVNPDDRKRLVEGLWKFGEVRNLEAPFRRKNGTVIYGLMSASMLEIDEVQYIISVTRDITERKHAEEKSLQIQKLEAIGTLAGGIAHDFNNLLQGVFGYISLAKLRKDDREKSVAALEEAEKALHLSVKLTNQLLTFSKGGKPVKKLLDLRPVIESSAKFALSGSRSDYRLVADDGLWQVEADEGQLGQVIQNIVLNADQAMPEGGQVEIVAGNVQFPAKDLPQGLPEGNYIEVAVKDSGVGIPENYLGKIFDPYFTTKEKGSGLGLATSYSIIKNHNGQINVQSEPGKGTTFFVYLPATGSTQAAVAPKPAAAAAAGRKGRILVMDDDQVIRTVAGHMLSDLGHAAEFAVHGEEAIRKYREARLSGEPFDVVILDLTVRGGMGGAETYKKLREIDPLVKAIISSGYSDDAVALSSEKQGFSAFLKKPYDVHGLRAVIHAMLNS